MTKFNALYAAILIVFATSIYVVLQHGQKLPTPRTIQQSTGLPSPNETARSGLEPAASLLANLRENLEDPLSRFFIQLILILVAARGCGALIRRVGQPAVIGEMLAGIVLGPSLLGW